jgi:hypothetical protein
MTVEEVVHSLYLALLGRPPAGGEEISKVAHLEAGGSVEELVTEFLESPECCLWFYRNPAFDALTAPDPLPVDTPRLYLWHLPKTGGSSLREMLRPHFEEHEFCGALTMSELYRMSNYRLRTFRVITGHFGPTLPQLLPEVPLITATVLRDPVEMIVSHYVHWRDQGNPRDPLTTFAQNTPFDDWCRSAASHGLWSNPQATSLCLPRIPPNRQQAEISAEGATLPIRENLLAERAAAQLEAIDIVGTTEDLVPVYRACLQSLGVEPTFKEALRENVGAGIDESVSASTRDWLLEHNTIDSRLYQRAQERSVELVAPARVATEAPARVYRPSHASVSTLIPTWSVKRLLLLAIGLPSLVAALDVFLPGPILIGLLIIGPCCALFTGRWQATAAAGLWAVSLAAAVGVPDGIWATAAYANFLAGVAVAAIAATAAAAIIERRHVLIR